MAARVAVRPLVVGLAVASLWGGHAAWAATAKTVTVMVDGRSQVVRTHGSTVKDVLAAAHLTVGAHDLLAPATDIELTRGTTVVLRHGRLMSLTVDGVTRSVWVTAMSVSEAIAQLGVRADGAVLSADRTRAIPLKGFSLEVRTRKTVQLLDGGKVRSVVTNGVLVADLLADQHVTVRPGDRLVPARGAALRNGQVVSITRVDGRSLVDTVPIPYGVVQQADSSMYKGDTRVVRAGRVGVLRRTFALTIVNGHLRARRLVSLARTASPQDEIVAYGTKYRPYSVPGADNLNWGALARCESGGNPRAVSSGGTYRGLYQFSFGSWYGVGGHGDPIDASSDEQTYRAKLLYMRSGRSPWPVCGQYL